MPDDLPGSGIQLDHARARARSAVEHVGAVGEEQQVAVVQHVHVVLLAEGPVAQLPLERPCIPVDDRHQVVVAEVHQQIAVVEGPDGVGVTELHARADWVERVTVHLLRQGGFPFPHRVAFAVDLAQHVPVDAVGVLGPRAPALDPPRLFVRQQLPGGVDGIAVGAPPLVVVVAGIGMLPDHVAVPVELQDVTALAAHVARTVGGLNRRQQVAAGQEVGVDPREARQTPLVHDLAAQVDQVRGLPPEGAEDRVARRRPRFVEEGESGPEVPHACWEAGGRRFSSRRTSGRHARCRAPGP